MKEFLEAFRALKSAPRALWLVVFAFAVDGAAYFGILPLMTSFITEDLHVSRGYSSWFVSGFTAMVTLVMLFVGKPMEDRLGVRFGILLALGIAALGRALYASSAFAGGVALLVVALLVVAIGEGILQPVAYAGIKKYTSEKNGAMGYALLYAFMNLGIAAIGPVSAEVRTTWADKAAAGTSTVSGFNAVNWACCGLTVATLLAFALAMTKRREREFVRNTEPGASAAAGIAAPPGASPFFDARFLFFIFALLPVRTLFAHQWLTMPEYVLHSFSKAVADKMELFVDSASPLLIFFLVPVATALTKRFHVVTMMIIGSAVTAGATFLLCFGPHTPLLALYFLVFSIGEALWSSRFLEYAAEIAPEGRVAQYMGVANIPWILAKATTGLYSGRMLQHFVPTDGPNRSETMWLIYGLVALASPVALLLARKWVLSGMEKRVEPAADVRAAA